MNTVPRWSDVHQQELDRSMQRAPNLAPEQLNAYLARLRRTSAAYSQLSSDIDGNIVGRFYRAELTTAFHAIYDAASHAAVGTEALVRCRDANGDGLSPWGLFMGAVNDDQAVALDRLCRTVHTLNYLRQSGRPALLFLKVHPRLVNAVATDHGRAFAKVLGAIGLSPRSVVIELDTEITAQPVLAAHACANYRWNGFRVALDFARPALAVQTLHTTRPDYVKFDIRDLRAAPAMAVSALAAASELGTRVIARRCETPADLDAAHDLGADLVQGYALGRPRAEFVSEIPVAYSVGT